MLKYFGQNKYRSSKKNITLQHKDNIKKNNNMSQAEILDELAERKELYISQEPEVVFEWNDPKSDAKGWIVINSLRNGAAGGGTRMRKGLTKDEVLALAKVMEVKFTVSGPPIGGAKSGIDFDPFHPDRDEVLKRWFSVVYPILDAYYGTGGDLNVDEIKDVIPLTEDLGLWHPQEGVVNGHFGKTTEQQIKRLGQLRYGCSKIIEDDRFVPKPGKKYAVADMITGYGVAESVIHFYDLFRSTSVKNKKMIVQGWGNVASAAAMFLAYRGVKVVGIIDRAGGLINEEGFTFQEVRALFTNKKGNQLHDKNMQPFDYVNERIWDLEAEIFIPGAASRLVSRDQVDRMIDKGLEVMSCGANVPFVDDEIFLGPTGMYTDSKVSLIPDFIANCGMARTFAYLMQENVEISDETIFGDTSNTIKVALEKVKEERSDGLYLAAIGMTQALRVLV